jgi:hypothetical protein
MATKKSTARDDRLVDALTSIQGTLVDIRTEARASNERLDDQGARLEGLRLEMVAGKTELRAELAATRTEIAATRIESNARLDVIGARLENIRDTMGESVRGQSRRIESVEDRVTRLEQGLR